MNTEGQSEETTSLIPVQANSPGSEYGGLSYRSAFSAFEPSNSSNSLQQQSQQSPSSSQQETGYQQHPIWPTDINMNPQPHGVQIVDVPPSSSVTHEPRQRTTSERFHCHVGGRGAEDDGEDSGDDDEICAATDEAAKRRNRARRRRRVSPSTRRAIRALWISVAVCLVFMVCEVVGGVWAQSLAIITDAAHLLTDLASMLISLFSLYLGSRPASQRMSFGWYRAEVVGAFVSVFMIWVVTGVLVYLAIERMVTAEYDIDAPVMAITAGLGVIVNIIMGAFLYFGGHSHSHLGVKHSHSHSHGHSHSDAGAAGTRQSRGASDSSFASSNAPLAVIAGNEVANSSATALLTEEGGAEPAAAVTKSQKQSTNINVRAAFIHVLGDLIQSVGVLIAALLILWNKSLAVMDPICTLAFSVIVVSTTVYIIRDALVVLLEGRPSSIDFSHVFEALEQIEGVRKVHDLRIWALTMDRVAISVHLEIASNAHAQMILKNTTLMLRRDFNVYESTVQIEGWRPESANCLQCTVPER